MQIPYLDVWLILIQSGNLQPQLCWLTSDNLTVLTRVGTPDLLSEGFRGFPQCVGKQKKIPSLKGWSHMCIYRIPNRHFLLVDLLYFYDTTAVSFPVPSNSSKPINLVYDPAYSEILTVT